MTNLSLLKSCLSCEAKCCRVSKLIGSPILDEEEALKIGKENLKEMKLSKESYWVIPEQEHNKCLFLTPDNQCKIQNIKPLDCLCYPLKAVYKEDSIVIIVDTSCPAHNHLSKEFLEEAKKIAIKSIKRFDKETYNHWLENNVGWVNETFKIIIKAPREI